MKINNKKELYIQKIDLLYLIESHIPVPESIYIKTKRSIINNQNNFIKFTKPEDITFLNSIPWIIEYNDIKDLSIEIISQMINELYNKKELLKSTIKPTNDKEKLKVFLEIQTIELKIKSLQKILWYKKDNNRLNIPKKIKRK